MFAGWLNHFGSNADQNQRLLLPKPPKLNPRRRLPLKNDFLRVTERLRCVTAGFLRDDRLLPKPPPEALRLAERNLVLLMLFSDFFDVERNLLDETLFPPAVFAADFAGIAFFNDDVAAPRRFFTELTAIGLP